MSTSAARSGSPRRPDARYDMRRQARRGERRRGASARSLLRLLLFFQLGDLRAQFRFVLRLRIERQRHAIERQRARRIAALRENVAEVLVDGRVAREDARGIVQILLREVEFALAEVRPAERIEIRAVGWFLC